MRLAALSLGLLFATVSAGVGALGPLPAVPECLPGQQVGPVTVGAGAGDPLVVGPVGPEIVCVTPGAAVCTPAVLPAQECTPPPGLGQLDPWVDAHGDEMVGHLLLLDGAKLGIGTSSPGAPLHVAGDARVEGAVQVGARSLSYDGLNDQLVLQAGGASYNTAAVQAGGQNWGIWHAGNDGRGGGLDADFLDGLDSGAFVRTSGDSVIEGALTIRGDLTMQPTSAGYGPRVRTPGAIEAAGGLTTGRVDCGGGAVVEMARVAVYQGSGCGPRAMVEVVRQVGGEAVVRLGSVASGQPSQFDFYLPDGTKDLRLREGSRDVMAWTSGGDVGIGTSAPKAQLHVQGDARIHGGIDQESGDFRTKGAVLADRISGLTPQQDTSVRGNRHLVLSASPTVGGHVIVSDIDHHAFDPISPTCPRCIDGNALTLRNEAPERNGGYVSLGFHMAGADSNHIAAVRDTSALEAADFLIKTRRGMSSSETWIKSDGRVGIGTSNPNAKLAVVGDIRATGPIAANTQVPLGDVAESVVGEGLAPGDVVVLDGIDPDGKLRVRISGEVMSREVAGVVSTNPSLRLAGLATDTPLAVTGIVPVKVVGQVARGDLLATSAVPGHAMACLDAVACYGAVLGKAVKAHSEDGPGIVLALVSLA